MSGLETNLKNTKPRLHHLETETETISERPRPTPRPLSLLRVLAVVQNCYLLKFTSRTFCVSYISIKRKFLFIIDSSRHHVPVLFPVQESIALFDFLHLRKK